MYIPQKYQSHLLNFYAHTKTCILQFTASFYIIAPNQRQHKSLSIGELLNKFWYIHTTEYYSAIERHTIDHVMTWVDLTCIICSKNASLSPKKYIQMINKYMKRFSISYYHQKVEDYDNKIPLPSVSTAKIQTVDNTKY